LHLIKQIARIGGLGDNGEKKKKKANAITKWFEDYDDDNVKGVVAYFCLGVYN
jgi:hypothetical protein